MNPRLPQRVEGFELVAFGGHRRVQRRTTRIQIRRNPLLIRWRGIGPGDGFKLFRSQVGDGRAANNGINETSVFDIVEPVVEEAGGSFLTWTNPIDCILEIACIKPSSPSCAAPNIAALVNNQVADPGEGVPSFPVAKTTSF